MEQTRVSFFLLYEEEIDKYITKEKKITFMSYFDLIAPSSEKKKKMERGRHAVNRIVGLALLPRSALNS